MNLFELIVCFNDNFEDTYFRFIREIKKDITIRYKYCLSDFEITGSLNI